MPDDKTPKPAESKEGCLVQLCKRNQLVKQLDEKIAELDKEAKAHKRMHRGLRYGLFLLSGVSAVLAGLAAQSTEIHSGNLNIFILIASSLAGVVTSIEGVRKPAELWILERRTCYALMDLKREVDYRICEPGWMDVDAYFNRMQDILSGAGSKWNQHVTTYSPGSAQPAPNPTPPADEDDKK